MNTEAAKALAEALGRLEAALDSDTHEDACPTAFAVFRRAIAKERAALSTAAALSGEPGRWWFPAEGPDGEMVCARCDQQLPNGVQATYALVHAERCEPGLAATEEPGLREALRAVLRDFSGEPTESYLDEAERIFRAALARRGQEARE